MRKLLLRCAILISVLAVFFFVWTIRGRQVTLWLDDATTSEVKSSPLTSLAYDGVESGGSFLIAAFTLSTTSPNNQPYPISVHPDAQGGFVLTTGEKSFSFGKPRPDSVSREF